MLENEKKRNEKIIEDTIISVKSLTFKVGMETMAARTVFSDGNAGPEKEIKGSADNSDTVSMQWCIFSSLYFFFRKDCRMAGYMVEGVRGNERV